MKGTIKSKAEIDSLFNTGEKINGRSLLIIARGNEQRGRLGRVAFVAGKKLGNSPTRNRAKRILRHAAREAGFPLDGMDIVLVAKKRILDMRFDQVVGDMKSLVFKIESNPRL